MASEADCRSAMGRSLSTLKNELRDALVYLDDGATDSVVSSVGVGAFFDLGAVNVHHLEKGSKRDAGVGAMLCSRQAAGEGKTPNVVVFATQLLHEAFESVVRLMKMHPRCGRFLIFCCYSVDAHAQLGSHIYTQNAYIEYEEKLVCAMEPVLQQEPVKVEVRFCPWLYSCLTSQAFMLLYPTTKSHLPIVVHLQWIIGCLYRRLSLGFEAGRAPDGDADRARDMNVLSHALIGVASHLGRKLDVFTLGPDAQAIGSKVGRMCVPDGLQEAPPEKAAALVLVDRAFDLVAPLHHADTLMDRILAAIEADTTPIQNGISRLTDLRVGLEMGDDGRISHTPLFAAEPSDLPSLVAHLLGRTCRDASLYVRKWIREEIRAAGLRSEYKPKAGAPNKEEFSDGAKILQSSIPNPRRQAVRTLALCTAKALDPESGLRTRAEIIHSNEQQILNLPSTDDLVKYFPDLLLNVSKPSALLEFRDVCGLLAFAYSILSDDTDEPFNMTEEKWILEAFVQCILDDPNPAVLQKLTGSGMGVSVSSAVKLEVRSAMQERMAHVKKLAAMRNGLKELRRLTPPLTPEHRSLVQNLVSLILEDKSIRDLHHVTSTLQGIFEGAPGKGLLTKGLGRLGLGKQQESAVGGHDLVIVFIVGGISLHEIDSISREVEEKGKGPWKPKILLGSNALLTPKQTVQQIWNL